MSDETTDIREDDNDQNTEASEQVAADPTSPDVIRDRLKGLPGR